MLPAAAVLALTACSLPPKAAGPRIYISDERGNAVLVLDPATGQILQQFAVGRRPRGLRLSPDGKQLYVAVSGSAIAGPGVDESKLAPPDRAADGIAVLDVATGQIQRVLKVGPDPETFAVAPDGGTLLVSNEDAALVSLVDVHGLQPTRQAKVGGEPEGVAITADGNRLFVACETSDEVIMFDRQLHRRASIAITGRPRTLLPSRDGRMIYVAVETAGRLAIIDVGAAKVIRSIDLSRGDARVRPMGLVESPDGDAVYVATGRAGTVLEVSPRDGRIMHTIGNVGARPWGIALTEDGRTLATANGPSGDVTLIDRATAAVRARYRAGLGPWGIVFGNAS